MPSFDFADTSVLDRPMARPRTSTPEEAVLRTMRRGINLVQLHDELWRVTRTDGEVLGYIESFVESRGRRFRTKRLIPRQARFLPLGEFWNFDDAVDCLRFG